MRPSPWVEHTVAVILCRAQGPTASSVQAKEVSTRNRTQEASEAPSTGRALSMIQEVQTSPAQAIKRLLPAPEGACLSIYLKRWGARESRERGQHRAFWSKARGVAGLRQDPASFSTLPEFLSLGHPAICYGLPMRTPRVSAFRGSEVSVLSHQSHGRGDTPFLLFS